MADVTIISDGTQDYFVKDAVAREDIKNIKEIIEGIPTSDLKNNKVTFTKASGSSSFDSVTLSPGSTVATLFTALARSVANTEYLNSKNIELEARIAALESEVR